jgi:hypothetical protein
MSDDYAPFPEIELRKLAMYYDEQARLLPRSPFAERAAMLRNAIQCHAAVRERMLIAETELNEFRRQQRLSAAAVATPNVADVVLAALEATEVHHGAE